MLKKILNIGHTKYPYRYGVNKGYSFGYQVSPCNYFLQSDVLRNVIGLN